MVLDAPRRAASSGAQRIRTFLPWVGAICPGCVSCTSGFLCSCSRTVLKTQQTPKDTSVAKAHLQNQLLMPVFPFASQMDAKGHKDTFRKFWIRIPKTVDKDHKSPESQAQKAAGGCLRAATSRQLLFVPAPPSMLPRAGGTTRASEKLVLPSVVNDCNHQGCEDDQCNWNGTIANLLRHSTNPPPKLSQQGTGAGHGPQHTWDSFSQKNIIECRCAFHKNNFIFQPPSIRP